MGGSLAMTVSVLPLACEAESLSSFIDAADAWAKHLSSIWLGFDVC